MQTLQDLRYALRGMRRSPIFALIAVVTLGLGTGAISTVLTLANTFFFRPVAADRPGGLVVVSATRRHGAVDGYVSWPDYVRFRDHNRTLAGLAAHYSTAPLFVSAHDHAREINGAVVSANFFSVLGLRPALGRFFAASEDRVPDRDRVAVLGFDLWRRWFDSSPRALGATVHINNVPFTVVGIAPAGFHGLTSAPDDIYIPAMMLHVGYRYCDVLSDADCTALSMIARLAPGRTVAQARAEMQTLAPPLWAHAAEGDNSGVTVSPARGSDPSGAEIRLVRILALVAAVLLLVCCANLAGLLTARGATRIREFAIRVSMGAGRGCLMRQLLTESIVLALVGAFLGMLISVALTRALNSMFYSMDDEGHALWYNFSTDPAVLLVVCAISIGAGFVFGFAPALRSSRLGAAEALRSTAPGTAAGSQTTQWLLGIQAALAVALVTVSALLLANTRAVLGGISFHPDHVALLRLRPRLLHYSPQRAQAFLRTAIQRLDSLPGVISVSMVGTGIVLKGGQAEVALPQWPNDKAQAVEAGYIDIGPRYFETLATPLLRGREFDQRDVIGSAPVAVVNRAMAERLWPRGNALGERVVVDEHPYRVVGIVEDVPLQDRTEPARPYVYVAYWQNSAALDARLCVRVRGNAAAMLPALAREVNRVDPAVPIAETITLPLQLRGMFQPLRVSATFLSWAAVLAVLLCAIGLYGAISFSVSRRTKEIGIRMALGAESRGVAWMVIRRGMRAIVPGVLAGVVIATFGERLLEHLLLGVVHADPLCYLGAPVLVASIALLACAIPARRAAAVEPLNALRQD